MSGNKGPMKKPNGKPTPKALALRRWNCESIEEMRQLIEYAEQEIAREKMLAEAHDPKFAGFMNQALGTRQDKKPLRVDPKTVMSMNNMPGYKHAFKFGMDIIKKMDPDTKEHFANEDDDALESYMIDIAEKKGFIPKYFVEEDLSEVVGEFEEIFHDPEMEGWSWADLLRDMIGQEPRAHEKANVQAHKQMMAKAQAEKDNPPPIDPNKLQVVDRTDTGKSEIWYPSGGFFGTDSWAVVQDGFKDKAHAEHALKQLKANPNVVNIIKKAIEDENMSESTGDKPFDTMMKSIKKGTKKQATADRREQKRQDQERTQDAIANMFGGGNPADKLSIRKKDVAESSKNSNTTAQKIFFARSNKAPKGWSYDHVGFITQDGRQIQMSGHKGNDVYVTNDVTDDPEFPKQNIKIVSLSKPVSIPTTNSVGAENCGTFVANVLQANGIKGIDTQKIYSVFKQPHKQDVSEGGGAQQAAIAIAKRESGKYTKDGKRKK